MQCYQKIPKEIKCPVCCNNNAHLLWDISSKQAAQHFVLQEKYPERFYKLMSHIENLWGQDNCEIVQCDKCGFCYSNPYIAGDEVFYTHAYVRPGYPTWKWDFQQTYDVLDKNSESNLKLMEIGAGNGAFIRRIADNILPKKNILCTEFSEYGRRQIENFGVMCLSEDFRNLSSVELMESFDVICIFQVLEHMDRLDVLFQKLNWLMKSGGNLFIAVPNPSRIEFNELNGALLDMPPNHIGRWNRKCFDIIGKRNGFRIENYKIQEYSLTSMAKEFTVSRLLQKSQQSGCFENKLFKIKNQYLCKIMQMVGFAVNLITAIPTLTKKDSQSGSAQWVHFIKAQN
jgi:SAM-dependent methyltransferase